MTNNKEEELLFDQWGEIKMVALIACVVFSTSATFALLVWISTNSATTGLATLGFGILAWAVCRRGLSLEKEFFGVIAAFVSLFVGGLVFLVTNSFWLGLVTFCGYFLFLVNSLRENKQWDVNNPSIFSS